MTGLGHPEDSQPPANPQPDSHRGVPQGVPPQSVPPQGPPGGPTGGATFGESAELTDSLLRQSARFSAMTGVVLYGLSGSGSLLTMIWGPSSAMSLEQLITAVFLTGTAAALGFGVSRSRRSGDTRPLLTSGLLIIALTGAYLVLTGAPDVYLYMPELFAVFVAPPLLTIGLAALAWLTERIQGPPTRRVTGVPADPYPWVSTAIATALYGYAFIFALVLFLFSLDGGSGLFGDGSDPTPINVQMSAFALCLPFPLLVIGLSASLSGRVRTSTPIFVTGTLAAAIVLVSVPQALAEFIDPWPIRCFLALFLTAPLLWPILRSWKGIPAPHRRSWLGL